MRVQLRRAIFGLSSITRSRSWLEVIEMEPSSGLNAHTRPATKLCAIGSPHGPREPRWGRGRSAVPGLWREAIEHRPRHGGRRSADIRRPCQSRRHGLDQRALHLPLTAPVVTRLPKHPLKVHLPDRPFGGAPSYGNDECSKLLLNAQGSQAPHPNQRTIGVEREARAPAANHRTRRRQESLCERHRRSATRPPNKPWRSADGWHLP